MSLRNLSFPLLTIAALFFLAKCKNKSDCNQKYRNWNSYLGDQGRSHYSCLKQINTENVHQLQVAWSYRSGGTSKENRSQIQCNPIIVDGILYATNPRLILFALDASSGEELWKFSPDEKDKTGLGVNRGVAYWQKGNESRILYSSGPFLYAVDAATGKSILSFGENGKVNMAIGLGRDPNNIFVVSNTPGAVYKDMIIMGSRVREGPGAAPGYIRAYNILDGSLVWTFHTIPHPDEFGYDTWPEGAWNDPQIGGANAWSGMSVDVKRGIIYVPTGSASFDFYGGNRHGANLFANTILALNAETGERIWHFQTIHHDLWDRDLPAPPNLVEVKHHGERIEAVAQITKSGFVFLLDRDTGEPLFPVEEIPVPPSDVPGEQAYATQPTPQKPPPFARQYFSEDQITDISAEATAQVKSLLEKYRNGGKLIPPSLEGTILLPGLDGGGEWGGAGYDPETGILYVNANEMPWLLQLIKIEDAADDPLSKGKNIYAQRCGVCHGVDRMGGSFMGKAPELRSLKQRLSETDFINTVKKGKGVMPSFDWMGEHDLALLKAYLYDLSPETLDIKTESDGEKPGLPYAHSGYRPSSPPGAL